MEQERVEQWKRKLLDLSLRNPLLNTRNSSKYLLLQDGTVYGRDSAATAVVQYSPPVAGEDFPFNPRLDLKDLKARLKELYNVSHAMYEDSGINPLYVAVGTLNWNEGDGGEFHRAPLTLMPAMLVRTTGPLGFKLVRTEEDGVVNFCLLELLRSQFKIPVGEIRGGGFDDGDPDYAEVYSVFAESVKSRPEWYVSTDIALGIFAFDKVVLWRDLNDHSDVMLRHALVRHLAERGGLFDDGIKVFPPEQVEENVDFARLFCPLSADASQMAAVIYSGAGKTFVLHGPPGTGKSQTITNMIAHNLTLGRKVLFVSEKKAALDVVYKRLTSIGLAPFCLELHSNKSRKINVMRQLAEAFDFGGSKPPGKWAELCTDMASLTGELGTLVNELHRKCANGRSVQSCIDVVSGKHPASSAALVPGNVAAMAVAQVDALAKLAEELGEEWKSIDREAFNALVPLKTVEWTPALAAKIRKGLTEIADRCRLAKRLVDRVKAMWCAWKWRRYIRLPIMSHPSRWIEAIDAVNSHLDGLRLVMAYRIKAEALKAAGCAGLVTAIERGDFIHEEICRVFEESVSERTLDELMSNNQTLAAFSGIRQDEKIGRLRRLDASYRDAVRKYVVAKVADALPDPELLAADEKKQYALLKRESTKKKRIMPIRSLLAETMPVAKRMKPCFLMSPLSVAQYLPAATAIFDVVIFDEASQMTVWDAVGAIARGAQFVCVGDPKQLPPTSFFVKGDAIEDDPDLDATAQDLESILDECLANGLFATYLNWHYRSRHESLIAFSNRHYYEDRLNTFPAAESNDRLGVSFRFVEDALYDHTTHTNEKEAIALVDYLFCRLESEEERVRSWGVVTFSVSQKRLIERLIEKRANGVEWAKEFFDDAKPDAFFVKNLENVQGDERDVIIFSIAYAPDAEGNFAMMFGPINHPGGERRLNVAITRAREQVIVFSATHSSEIHAERTNSVGVRHLKALMDYAETGRLDGDGRCVATDRSRGLIGEVRRFLESHGYEVVENVGRSSMPIDLAVRDPGNANRYVLAIELDGSKYASQWSVRDRDILREDVLRDLGWNYLRLWSIDWAFDRKRTEKRILDALPVRE